MKNLFLISLFFSTSIALNASTQDEYSKALFSSIASSLTVVLPNDKGQPLFQLTFEPRANPIVQLAINQSFALRSRLCQQKKILISDELDLIAKTKQLAAAEWLVHTQIIEILRPFTESPTHTKKDDLIAQFFQPVDPKVYCTSRTIKQIDSKTLTPQELQNTPQFVFDNSNRRVTVLQSYILQFTMREKKLTTVLAGHQKRLKK